ncbi:O-methyltransferase [Marinomonas mediterranea]|jgi:Predicted O-methyltransferase|uniref:Caffeoyl-CoA O-methyltransferase n=1 Tax=Marinomonas mediterranea (strain ATCC 700492 / JCM 21426 / NBRC 103028 / MMB-1) TaxID=717774 RepID=F2K2P4_MARM1|nr:class I SAM-dependent methyltransferase [Marinomonas mediterranea]ADZ91177.1 Caffeoyl-CoA O-methyltransferase [Marinomonas mediterranea MMB-1]WCN09154.1 SAM-dependent methyltransferase [Marinomonas mediterranea]WCN13230.1 SAM-dependent methyltransferase [Marinomonas mediterranea]WCN17306.1 SAM-dependent methyltransferase [Marinomonas mediterranea MMB-1]
MLPNFPKPVSEENRPVNRTVKVDDTLYDYLIDHSVREPEVLDALRRETAQYHMARMALSPEVGQFLGMLVSLVNPKKVLEIGVFTGYSTISIARYLSKDATMLAVDKKQMWLDIANRYLEQAEIKADVKTVCANAVEVMQDLVKTESGTYDFLFIDADKANLMAYYTMGIQLLSSGGCLIIDNTLWWGNVANAEFDDKDTVAVRALNDYIHSDADVTLSQLPIGDGLTIVRKQ